MFVYSYYATYETSKSMLLATGLTAQFPFMLRLPEASVFKFLWVLVLFYSHL